MNQNDLKELDVTILDGKINFYSVNGKSKKSTINTITKKEDHTLKTNEVKTIKIPLSYYNKLKDDSNKLERILDILKTSVINM